jgi:hypothetical protein
MAREKDVSYSMLISHYFPSESGRNSLTLSKYTNMASIHTQDLTNIQAKCWLLNYAIWIILIIFSCVSLLNLATKINPSRNINFKKLIVSELVYKVTVLYSNLKFLIAITTDRFPLRSLITYLTKHYYNIKV